MFVFIFYIQDNELSMITIMTMLVLGGIFIYYIEKDIESVVKLINNMNRSDVLPGLLVGGKIHWRNSFSILD